MDTYKILISIIYDSGKQKDTMPYVSIHYKTLCIEEHLMIIYFHDRLFRKGRDRTYSKDKNSIERDI